MEKLKAMPGATDTMRDACYWFDKQPKNKSTTGLPGLLHQMGVHVEGSPFLTYAYMNDPSITWAEPSFEWTPHPASQIEPTSKSQPVEAGAAEALRASPRTGTR